MTPPNAAVPLTFINGNISLLAKVANGTDGDLFLDAVRLVGPSETNILTVKKGTPQNTPFRPFGQGGPLALTSPYFGALIRGIGKPTDLDVYTILGGPGVDKTTQPHTYSHIHPLLGQFYDYFPPFNVNNCGEAFLRDLLSNLANGVQSNDGGKKNSKETKQVIRVSASLAAARSLLCQALPRGEN